MKTITPALKSFFATSSAWAIVCCIVAAASTLLVWDVVTVFGIPMRLQGIDSWYGRGVADFFAAMALILIATHSDKTIPLWKPIVIGVSGVGLLALMGWYATAGRAGTETIRIGGDVSHQLQVKVPLGEGVYVAMVAALGLLLVAALQIRRDRPPQI